VKRGTSPAHVADVLSISDRVLRNYWVTQSYADLSRGVAAILDPASANWCTFGTWASFTVGENLRGEAIPGWLHDRVMGDDGMMGAIHAANSRAASHGIGHVIDELRPEHLEDLLRDLFGACASNLSDGNTEVFSEIAPGSATFIESFSDSSRSPEESRQAVLAVCKDAPEFEGVNRLAAGYSLWCDAMGEVDPVRKSQLIVAGSCQLGAHEQHHLQAAISGSMDMGVNQSAGKLHKKLDGEGHLEAKVADAVADILRPVETAVGDAWGSVMTALLGTIMLPEGTFRLDHDVPQSPDGPFIPGDLDPVVVAELDEVLSRFDRSDGHGRRSAAADWVSLDDRMNYIVNLFRSRHHRSELFAEPFGEAVIASIEADEVPLPSPHASAS